MKFFIAVILCLAVCGYVSAQSAPGGFTPIQYSARNQTLLSLYNYGCEIAQIDAISQGQSSGGWVFITVNSLGVQQVANGNNYQFNVAIVNGIKGSATLIFVVHDSPLSLLSWQLA